MVFNPDWDQLLTDLRQRLKGCRVYFIVPSEDASIKWIRVMAGVGIMDLVGDAACFTGRQGRVLLPGQGLGL